VRLSIPLMLGVSLVTADDWILRYFASSSVGDITRLNYAKRLFAVPIAVLGQATGQASLPFFARLFGEKRIQEFSATVNASIYRIAAASLLASSLMIVTATPLIDLVYRRGRMNFADSQTTAVYFFCFSLSLAFWSSQALYARAFYAAGDTLTPMIASSIITAASIPIYAALYHSFSTVGLAVASDFGIVANTVVIAVLLHRRGLVPADELQWAELGKALITAAFAGVLSYFVAHRVMIRGNHWADLYSLALVSLTWAAAVALGLWLTKSQLPGDLRRRKGVIYPRVAERQAEETSRGAEP
jgi:putative peptidoglycan lipid II flippase